MRFTQTCFMCGYPHDSLYVKVLSRLHSSNAMSICSETDKPTTKHIQSSSMTGQNGRCLKNPYMLSTGLFCAKAAISMYQEPIKKPRSYTTKLQTKPEHQPDHHQVQAIRFLHFIKPHLHTQTHTTKKLRHFAENHPKQSTLC